MITIKLSPQIHRFMALLNYTLLHLYSPFTNLHNSLFEQFAVTTAEIITYACIFMFATSSGWCITMAFHTDSYSNLYIIPCDHYNYLSFSYFISYELKQGFLSVFHYRGSLIMELSGVWSSRESVEIGPDLSSIWG